MKKVGLVLCLSLAMISFLISGSANAQPVRNPPPMPRVEDELKPYLKTSPLVVVGKVVEINAATSRREDAAQWQVAMVKVSQTLKGDPRQEVLVVFAASNDRTWHDSPKLTVGQESIFILHNFMFTQPNKIRGGIFFSVLTESQVQPMSRLKLVKRLLRSK